MSDNFTRDAPRREWVLSTALARIAMLGENGCPPDHTEWVTFHSKVVQIAREALAKAGYGTMTEPREEAVAPLS